MNESLSIRTEDCQPHKATHVGAMHIQGIIFSAFIQRIIPTFHINLASANSTYSHNSLIIHTESPTKIYVVDLHEKHNAIINNNCT